MPSHKDISSTERLLTLIRNKETREVTSDTPKVSPSETARKENLRGGFAKKALSVGVDITDDEVRLVKVRQLSNGQSELLSYKRVSVARGIVRGTAEHASFMKATLEEFCGSGRGLNIWSLIRSDTVDVENIRIPKVAKKQLENAVYWTVKKNSGFDKANMILDFEVQGEVVEEGVTKLSVVVCTAPKREVEEIEKLFEGIGFPLTGLTAAPFALQNLFRADWMPVPARAATLFIGDDSSRIDVFSLGNLTMTRGIRAGIDSMADSLLEEHTATILPKEQDDILDTEIDHEQPQTIITLEDARDLVFSLGVDSPPPHGKTDRFGLSKEKIFEMIQPALERLVRQVERTLEHYTVILGNEGIDFIYVFSDGGVYRPVTEYIGGQLRVDNTVLDPMDPDNPLNNITEHTSVSQRASLTSALGLALSSMSRTLNLICTHRDKEKIAQTSRVNRSIASAFAVAALILIGLFFWMGIVIERKEAVLTQLDHQMKTDIKTVQESAYTMVSQIDKNRLTLKQFHRRYWGAAVIGELSRLSPPDICLSTVTATMGRNAEEKAAPASAGMMISGVVTGPPDSLEASLARYVLALKGSQIFEEVTIDKETVKPFHTEDALHFNISVSFPGA